MTKLLKNMPLVALTTNTVINGMDNKNINNFFKISFDFSKGKKEDEIDYTKFYNFIEKINNKYEESEIKICYDQKEYKHTDENEINKIYKDYKNDNKIHIEFYNTNINKFRDICQNFNFPNIYLYLKEVIKMK